MIIKKAGIMIRLLWIVNMLKEKNIWVIVKNSQQVQTL